MDPLRPHAPSTFHRPSRSSSAGSCASPQHDIRPLPELTSLPRIGQAQRLSRHGRSRRARLPPGSGGTASRPAPSPAAATTAATCPGCSRSRPPSRRLRAQAGDRREFRFAQADEGAGQQHRDRARMRPSRARRRRRCIRDDRPTRRSVSGGHRGAAEMAQLLGMQLDRQALRARRVEHAPGLFEA